MVDVPIDTPCRITLTDSKSYETSGGCKTKSSGCSHSTFYARYKYAFLFGAVSFLLIVTLLRLTYFIIFVCNDHNASAGIQPESRVERVIRQNHPLGKRALSEALTEGVIDEVSSLSDRTKLVNRITRDAKYETFPAINEVDVDSKRELSRARRDCEQSAQHCATVLQMTQDYLKALKNRLSTIGLDPTSVSADIMKCLHCEKLLLTVANEVDVDHTPRTKDRYYPHDPVEQDQSSDPGIAVIKMLDEAKEGTKLTAANRTEAAKIRVTVSIMENTSRDVTNQTLKDTGISQTTAMSIDHTKFNESQQMHVDVNSNLTASVTDANPIAIDSHVKSNESVPVASNVHQHNRTIAEVTASDAVTIQFTTMESSTTTQYSNVKEDAISGGTTIAADSIGSTETSTRNSVDLTKQTAITENVTSVPVGHDVTGISGIDDGATHPSTYPSTYEGHPENQSAAAANGLRSMEGYRAFERILPADRFQTKDNKPIPATAESTKSFQQLQLTPTMWTTAHPVCFYGYPGQSSNMPLPSGAAFSPNSFGFSSPQNREFPFQNQQDSSPPNYVQVQANTVQFLPRFNYAGNPPQAHPTGQGIGPTGPAVSNMPISSLNQQPIPNVPYFCGYMSLPTLRFPPISGTSQADRSADKAKDLFEESPEPSQRNNIIWQNYPEYPSFNSCPINYHQCDNLFCIPKVKWCDGRVDCADASDETRCSCRDRISQDRLCDGYFDCPHGEDELGCFDCPADSFSCDVWDNRYHDNCVPFSQRCDDIKQCSNGKDELDCNILSESYIDRRDIFTVGYTQGYLHKNIQGQWYPVCSSTFSWAMDACASEIGQSITTMPEIQIVRVSENVFQDPYIKESDNGQMQFASCPGTAVFVKCPPLPCGTKALPRQDSSSTFNATRNNYMSKRHVEKQSVSDVTRFNKLYQEMLGLLDANHSVSKGKKQDQNETIVGSQSRVVGGRTSQPRAWPFLVAIYKDGYFHCGGIILNEAYVLTAGHCMDGYESHYYEIQAGMLRQLSFSPMAQSRKASYVIIHSGYERENMQNDIAIIVLDKPLLFNRWVRQVCLPEWSTAGPEWKEGPTPQTMCVAIGWGALREYGPDPDHLREVEVPILPSCKYLVDLNTATICAGYPEGGQDACQGDSGGPLMCRNPNLESQWYVAGIISHGDGCARPNEPGVYMKVSYFVDWIHQIFETLGNFTIPLDRNKPLDSCPGFSCGLGKCLPKENRCDRVVDCLNGEDEINCYSQADYGKYKQSEFDNEIVQSQADGTSRDTTENQINTKVTSVPTSFDLFDKKEMQTDINDNTANVDATTPETTMSSVRITFTCTRLIQTITINKRCDRRLDCEDGTDEDDCTCRDYLSKLQPTAICDGHLDCDDETDEENCGICADDEFHCSKSRRCVPMTKRCNGDFDCPMREDELDCLALTDGEYLNMDSDNRTVLNMEGLLSRNYQGTWRVQCPRPETLDNDTVTSTIGRNLCKYLGFANFQSLDRIVVDKTVLETRYWRRSGYVTTSPRRVAADEGDETCTTLRIRCRPVLSGSAETHMIVDPRTGNYTYLWPWLAAIFVDGRYRCSALLLEPDWLLSSSSCTEGISLSVNYTTALLGQSRSYLYVDGPHQQISFVDEIRNVKTSDVSLLHLKTAVNFTRYVQPLFLEKRIYPPQRDDVCVAVGTDKQHVTQSIFLQPILQNCDKCYRCFVKTSGFECPANGTSSDWSGTVFCLNENGWYPAAVFHENDGLCSFQNRLKLTSIDYIHAYLMQALGEELQPTPEPTCDGVLCNIGQCILWNRVCDDVADCRDGADESFKMRNMIQNRRSNEANRKCEKSDLRCRNGECIPKSAFCDAKVDCSDGTDEPVTCSCAEYLKLTAPERLCDGVRHCLDKTDESPEMCRCTETSFKCDEESKNLTCVSQDFVCDGEDDCPNGEDETECVMLEESADDRPDTGEVIRRTYGVWHSRCFASPMTQERAGEMCRDVGYADGIIDNQNKNISEEPLLPSRDDFHMIRLNPNTWIIMRDDKPLINLVPPEDPCYRPFVKCNDQKHR